MCGLILVRVGWLWFKKNSARGALIRGLILVETRKEVSTFSFPRYRF